jgi:hypothetical protein
MKKVIFLFLVVIGCQLTADAQSEKYVGAMVSTLQQLKDANDEASLTAVIAKFERIADAEKTQWLPYYYAAMLKARMAQQKMGGDADKVADDAQILLDKAEALSPNNSEIFCVKNMIGTARMLVDPAARYMQFMSVNTQALESAKKADPTNPRPYVLQSMSLKYTPENFGGGCKTAKPLAQKAVELFATFKPTSPLHPNWGKELVDGIVTDCK